MMVSMIELPIATKDGTFVAHYSEKGLAGLDFPERANGRVISGNPRTQVEVLRWHRITSEALKSVLAGREPKAFPPLDPQGTEFQQKVWAVLRRIAMGKTKSYGEVA